MKDIKYFLRLMLLASCALFGACSDDDEDKIQPVFPQSQVVSGEVGEEKVLTFEAADNWTLTSSALWCKFKKGEEQVYACSGSAGNQSVTVCIGDEASELLKTYEAELTLTMGGQQQVICKVTRPATGYEVRVFGEDESVEFNSGNPVLQDYDGKQKLVVKANFDWKVVLPEGLSSGVVSGIAGEKVVLAPALVKGFTKNAWQAAFRFQNRDNQVVAEAPVTYDGIPADRIEFSNENPLGSPVTFSTWGDSYKIGEVEYEGEMPLTVTAREDKYTLVYVEYKEVRNELTWEYEYEFTRLAEEDSWFRTEDDRAGNIKLTADYNNEQERTAYLMVFPDAVYERVKDNFEAMIFSTEGLQEPYSDYVAVRIAQTANPRFTTGFTITDGEGNPLTTPDGETVEAISYQNAIGASDEELIATYGTSNVYVLSLPMGVAFDNILAIPNGFTGYYVQPNTYVGEYPDGYDTAWNGVEVQTDWGMSAGKGVAIYGIGADTNSDKEMVINCLNNSDVYAVLIVFPRYD